MPELSPPATQASQAVPLLCAARSGASHGTKQEPARDPDATAGSRTGAAALPGTGAAAQPARLQGGAREGLVLKQTVQQGALRTWQLTGRSGTEWIFRSRGWDTSPPRALAPEMASSPVPGKVEQLAFLAAEPVFEGSFLGSSNEGEAEVSGQPIELPLPDAHFCALLCLCFSCL